ncbi:hypothetical protein KJ365_13200 [Glaciecola sp. XM2]|uniref:hypothetical protein n=1 Tax=Glaciecola sp. XM2 TaxID=1914931 RepID=UPI001BDE11CD|nr:hypothetical protein [Glaciecola sp. XM2]MBT1451843.1 hypothetical protein [Glaciecola sp. XM2]
MSITPKSKASWAIFMIGLGSLLFSMWVQGRMWQVEMGLRPVSSGGGEYMMALFVGVPSLLVSILLLSFAAFRKQWQSAIGVGAFGLSLILLVGFVIVGT